MSSSYDSVYICEIASREAAAGAFGAKSQIFYSQSVHQQQMGQSRSYHRDRFCNHACTSAEEKSPEKRRSIDCAQSTNNHIGSGSEEMFGCYIMLT